MTNLVYVFLDNNFLQESPQNPYTYTELPEYYKATYFNNKNYAANSFFITQKKYCFDNTCIDVDEIKYSPEYKQTLNILQTHWGRYANDPFWFNTTIRVILLLLAVIKKDLKNVLHLEADNILFEPITKISHIFNDGEYGYSNEAPHACAPCCMFIKDKEAAQKLLEQHLVLFERGETQLRPHVGHFANYITDMAFLDIIYRLKRGYKMLPCTPQGVCSENFETIETVIDPNPYGMYFFGTNQGHSPGYIETRHFVGHQIANSTIVPKLINNKPFIVYRDKLIPIFNLHMHNKKAILPFLEHVKS